jgi:L-Ala-D/L-Glu epimerase
LIVDANEGWLPEILPAMLAACETFGVELVEQPLPADDDEALRGLKSKTLICADESAHGLESLAGLKGKYDAVNIKLDKTGGLTPALAMADAAKAHGFKLWSAVCWQRHWRWHLLSWWRNWQTMLTSMARYF